MLKRIFKNGIIFLLGLLVLSGCSYGDTKPVYTTSSNNTGFYSAIPGNYDSADMAVLVKIDMAASTMQFRNIETNRKYTLNYDGATTFYDRNGQPLTLLQLNEGDVVDVTFMKDRKRLNSLNISPECFYLSNVNNFEIHASGHKMLINGEDYTLPEEATIMCPHGEGELIDINNVDVLAVSGENHTIYSIRVEQSHGYLRLTGESFFVGGWMEIAKDKVYQIEEDMLVAVPAGTIEVSVSNKGCIGTEVLYVEAGKEYELDISKFQGEAEKGSIIFTINPSNAKVFIDNKEVDISEPVELEYGIHQMTIKADGYLTITKYIKVASASANVDITMEKDNSVSNNSASQNSVSGNVSGNSISNNSASNNSASVNSASGNSASSNQPSVSNNQAVSNNQPSTNPNDIITTSSVPKVYIDSPEGVEVYVNGVYAGITPLSFNKKTGVFEFILRRPGYENRSYTIELDSTNENVTYSFSEMIPVSQDNENNNEDNNEENNDDNSDNNE